MSKVTAQRLQADARHLLLGYLHLHPTVALERATSFLMREWGVSDSRAMHNARIAQKQLEAEREKR